MTRRRRVTSDWSAREDLTPALCGDERVLPSGEKFWTLLVLMDWDVESGRTLPSYSRLLIREDADGSLQTDTGRVFPLGTEEAEDEPEEEDSDDGA
jgi:hypothetical protein